MTTVQLICEQCPAERQCQQNKPKRADPWRKRHIFKEQNVLHERSFLEIFCGCEMSSFHAYQWVTLLEGFSDEHFKTAFSATQFPQIILRHVFAPPGFSGRKARTTNAARHFAQRLCHRRVSGWTRYPPHPRGLLAKLAAVHTANLIEIQPSGWE